MSWVEEQDKHSEDGWLRPGAAEAVGDASMRTPKVQKQQKKTTREDMLSISQDPQTFSLSSRISFHEFWSSEVSVWGAAALVQLVSPVRLVLLV